MQTIDLGNNEKVSFGIVENQDGFLALTPSASKQFKKRTGAIRWLAKRGIFVK